MQFSVLKSFIWEKRKTVQIVKFAPCPGREHGLQRFLPMRHNFPCFIGKQGVTLPILEVLRAQQVLQRAS